MNKELCAKSELEDLLTCYCNANSKKNENCKKLMKTLYNTLHTNSDLEAMLDQNRTDCLRVSTENANLNQQKSEMKNLVAKLNLATHAKTVSIEQMAGQLSKSSDEICQLKDELNVATHANTVSIEQMAGQLSKSSNEIFWLKDELNVATHAKTVSIKQMAGQLSKSSDEIH